MGWAEFGNGNLLLEAEAQFNVFVTTDQNLRYQQNLANRGRQSRLPFASWPKLERYKSKIVAAIEALQPGDYLDLRCPNSSPLSEIRCGFIEKTTAPWGARGIEVTGRCNPLNCEKPVVIKAPIHVGEDRKFMRPCQRLPGRSASVGMEINQKEPGKSRLFTR